MNLKGLITALFLALPLGLTSICKAQNQQVTVVIYVDASDSMFRDLSRQGLEQAIAPMVNTMKNYCNIQMAVSDLMYQTLDTNVPGGGQLIHNPGEPAFVTSEDEEAGEIIAQRILKKRVGLSGLERTYSSLNYSLEGHLDRAPKPVFGKDNLVATLLITDAEPSVEDGMAPVQVTNRIRSFLKDTPFVSSAIGSYKGRCVDRVPMGTFPSGFRIKHGWPKPEALKQFAELNNGYHWNICQRENITQQIEEFFFMIIEQTGCMKIVRSKPTTGDKIKRS